MAKKTRTPNETAISQSFIIRFMSRALNFRIPIDEKTRDTFAVL